MVDKTKIYKIMNSKGQFSKGGMAANTKWGWSDEGKTWSGPGPLRRHLAQFLPGSTYCRNGVTGIPEDWIVVEITVDFSMTEDSKTSASAVVDEFPAIDFYNNTHI